jgi:hypothetical protein
MSKPLTEISTQEFDNRIGSLLGGVFIFYLLLSGNYTGELLNCQFQNILRNSIIVKHVVGFLMMYFFVNMASTNVNWNAGIKLGLSFILFLLFLLSNRCDGYIVFANICLMGLIYILQLARDTDQNIVDDESSSEDDKKAAMEKINSFRIVQILSTVTLFILIGFGFILYIGRRKLEYGQQFNYKDLLFGAECANDAGEKYKYMDMLKAAFKAPPNYELEQNGNTFNLSPKAQSPSVLSPVKLSPASLSRKSNELATLLDSELIRTQLKDLLQNKYQRAVRPVPSNNSAFAPSNAVGPTARLLATEPTASTAPAVLQTVTGSTDPAPAALTSRRNVAASNFGETRTD